MGFRKKQDVYSPLHINREMEEWVQIPVHARFGGPLIGHRHHLTSQEAQNRLVRKECFHTRHPGVVWSQLCSRWVHAETSSHITQHPKRQILSHPSFELLPSRKHCRSINTCITRFMNRFHPKAIIILNLVPKANLLKGYGWKPYNTIISMHTHTFTYVGSEFMNVCYKRWHIEWNRKYIGILLDRQSHKKPLKMMCCHTLLISIFIYMLGSTANEVAILHIPVSTVPQNMHRLWVT